MSVKCGVPALAVGTATNTALSATERPATLAQKRLSRFIGLFKKRKKRTHEKFRKNRRLPLRTLIGIGNFVFFKRQTCFRKKSLSQREIIHLCKIVVSSLIPVCLHVFICGINATLKVFLPTQETQSETQ